MRLSRALDAFVTHLALALLPILLLLAAQRLGLRPPPWLTQALLLLAALQLVLGVAFSALRKLPKLAGAIALDEHHGLDGRIASALSFAELPPEERSPMMEAAILDACERAHALQPNQAVSLARPKHLPFAGGLLVASLLVSLLPAPRPSAPTRAASLPKVEPIALADDDLALFREVAEEFQRGERGEAVQLAAQELNRLIEEIADERLDRQQAFQKLLEIEEALSKKRVLDRRALEEQLALRAKALRGSELLKPTSDALQSQDLAKAERALRELAERMRNRPDSFDKKELERLREAMREAAGSQEERLAALEKHREELLEQLLARRQKAENEGLDDEEERLLKRDERRLERLERDREDFQEAGRRLERLDRELAKAAEDILRELDVAAEDLERGAEDINRLAREEASQADREELLRRLEELREQLRQEGQGGKKRRVQMRRFVRMARGGGEGGGGREGEGEGERGRGGEREGGGERAGGREGEGESGGGRGGEGGREGEIWAVGEGGEKVLTVQKGGAREGSGPGQGRGGEAMGEATEGGAAKMQDVQAVGLDTGEGASRSEIIEGASGKGFRGGGYKRVYKEYRTVTEEQIRGDEIPQGAASHVRRYFDLIRPRE